MSMWVVRCPFCLVWVATRLAGWRLVRYVSLVMGVKRKSLGDFILMRDARPMPLVRRVRGLMV